MSKLLAVSGGIDSMYLAESFFRQNLSFAVAHCNFALRAEESDGDEAFVRNWCETRAIVCHTVRFDTDAYAREQHISTEMAARELRYSWFAKLCAEHGYESVVVAHNANDNAETLMLNLTRGTGSRGLRGMSSDTVINGLRIERPILGTSRAEIEAWMKSNGCSWREDHTNAQNVYKRNIIRNQVFPLLAQVNPSFIRTLNQDMKRFSQVDDIAEDYFVESMKRITLPDGSISSEKLMECRHWKYLLFRATEGKLNSSELESLEDALESGRNTAGKRFGSIICTRSTIILESAADAPEEPLVELIPRSELTTLRQEPGILIFDADKLPLPLEIREAREGDWMIPLGMKGKKKLSDMFTDLRYSLVDKKKARVISYPGSDSRIAALIGVRSDDSLKVTDATRRVIRITSR